MKPFFELTPPSHPKPRIWLQSDEGKWELVPFPRAERPVHYLELWGLEDSMSYHGRGFIQYTGDQERWASEALSDHWYTDLVDSLQCVWIAIREIVWRVFHA